MKKAAEDAGMDETTVELIVQGLMPDTDAEAKSKTQPRSEHELNPKQEATFPFPKPELYGDVRTIAAKAGIELIGDAGQPHCCQVPMRVKAGLMGADYACCQVCQNTIINMASPHVNGGLVFTEDTMKDHGQSLWLWRPPDSTVP